MAIGRRAHCAPELEVVVVVVDVDDFVSNRTSESDTLSARTSDVRPPLHFDKIRLPSSPAELGSLRRMWSIDLPFTECKEGKTSSRPLGNRSSLHELSAAYEVCNTLRIADCDALTNFLNLRVGLLRSSISTGGNSSYS